MATAEAADRGGTADSPGDDRGRTGHPSPRRTFRIRTLMLVVAVVAAWLAFFREFPWFALLLASLAGPTVAIHRWFLKIHEADTGRRPGPFTWCTSLLASAWIALFLVMSILILLASIV
jgi:uncharacterized membrane-anchored protein